MGFLGLGGRGQQHAVEQAEKEARFWKQQLDAVIEEKNKYVAKHLLAVRDSDILRAELFLRNAEREQARQQAQAANQRLAQAVCEHQAQLQQERLRATAQLRRAAGRASGSSCGAGSPSQGRSENGAGFAACTPGRGAAGAGGGGRYADEERCAASQLRAEGSLGSELDAAHSVARAAELRAATLELQLREVRQEAAHLVLQVEYLRRACDAHEHEADALRGELLAQRAVESGTSHSLVALLGELSALREANARLAAELQGKDSIVGLLEQQLADLGCNLESGPSSSAPSHSCQGQSHGAAGGGGSRARSVSLPQQHVHLPPHPQQQQQGQGSPPPSVGGSSPQSARRSSTGGLTSEQARPCTAGLGGSRRGSMDRARGVSVWDRAGPGAACSVHTSVSCWLPQEEGTGEAGSSGAAVHQGAPLPSGEQLTPRSDGGSSTASTGCCAHPPLQQQRVGAAAGLGVSGGAGGGVGAGAGTPGGRESRSGSPARAGPLPASAEHEGELGERPSHLPAAGGLGGCGAADVVTAGPMSCGGSSSGGSGSLLSVTIAAPVSKGKAAAGASSAAAGPWDADAAGACEPEAPVSPKFVTMADRLAGSGTRMQPASPPQAQPSSSGSCGSAGGGPLSPGATAPPAPPAQLGHQLRDNAYSGTGGVMGKISFFQQQQQQQQGRGLLTSGGGRASASATPRGRSAGGAVPVGAHVHHAHPAPPGIHLAVKPAARTGLHGGARQLSALRQREQAGASSGGGGSGGRGGSEGGAAAAGRRSIGERPL